MSTGYRARGEADENVRALGLDANVALRSRGGSS